MPKPFPLEFRRDVISVARQGGQSIAQVAKGFGVSESWGSMTSIESRYPVPTRPTTVRPTSTPLPAPAHVVWHMEQVFKGAPLFAEN